MHASMQIQPLNKIMRMCICEYVCVCIGRWGGGGGVGKFYIHTQKYNYVLHRFKNNLEKQQITQLHH